MRKIMAILFMLAMCSGCAQNTNEVVDSLSYVSKFEEENMITVSDEKIELNGENVGESGDVFISHDIIYYEDKESYESGRPYGEGEAGDKHTKEEAEAHTVLNITKSGAYRINGTLSAGQIRVDLGDEANKNPDAVVELILDNADITCTVAPAILFQNVYECDQDWSVEDADYNVDTSKAGAVLVLADGSENNINGSYVEKIFKDEEGEEKLWKQDGAIYSYMSMNVYGGGTLTLHAENEGMDTELHLTIHGGNIHIYSQNDGINTNEDNVSVTTINGGNVKIVAGLGAEGDGIDSNGWLVINGGIVTASANPAADAGLDSDCGSFINGGTVVALGSTMDWPESDSKQIAINLQFTEAQNSDRAIVVKDKNDEIVFAYKPTEEKDKTVMRGFSGAVISCPDFEEKGEYTIYMGGTLEGEEKNGVYVADSITGYKDGEQQGYYGTDLRGGGRGHKHPAQMPEGERQPMQDGERPPMQNGERPQRPDGEPPKAPDREMMPEGAIPPMHDAKNYAEAEQQTVFVMNDKVNLFSGVAAIK